MLEAETLDELEQVARDLIPVFIEAEAESNRQHPAMTKLALLLEVGV